MRTGSAAVVLALAAAGCGGTRYTLTPESNTQTQENVISVWANWVKDKGEKFDVDLRVKNLSDKMQILYSDDITGSRGATTGTIKHARLGIGERTIDIAPGQTKSLVIVCIHDGEPSGDFVIRLGRIYDNPSGDRKTSGAVVSEGIEWRLAESTLE